MKTLLIIMGLAVLIMACANKPVKVKENWEIKEEFYKYLETLHEPERSKVYWEGRNYGL